MDSAAFARAKLECETAQTKLSAMRTAPDIKTLAALWSEFLTSAQRCFTKLRKATEAGPSKGWMDQVVHTRNQDELLSYILHARNADEHGIKAITEEKDATFSLRPKVGTDLHIKSFAITGGQILIDRETADKVVMEFTPRTIRLAPVTDRGRTYDPPRTHLGQPVDNPDPITVAELASSYLAGIVAEAAQKFG